MVHRGTNIPLRLLLLLSSLLVSSFVNVGQAGDDRNAGRKLAGENPLTAKETLTSYWKNHISNALPKPRFFMDKVSPLNALDLATFSKLAEERSLSIQLHDFCSKANLICGSESSTKRLNQYVAARKEIKNDRVEPGKYFRESMLKPGTLMPMFDIRDKMPKRSFLPRVISSELPLTSNLFGEFKEIFQDCLPDDKPVSDKKSGYHSGYGDSGYQGSYDEKPSYNGGYDELKKAYHGGSYGGDSTYQGGYDEKPSSYNGGYDEKKAYHGGYGDSSYQGGYDERKIHNDQAGYQGGYDEKSGNYNGGYDEKKVYHGGYDQKAVSKKGYEGAYIGSKVALHECAVAPNRGEMKKCVGSGEDVIDFATSVLGRNVELRTTENTRGVNGEVLIGSVKGINAGKATKLVLCHQTLHPYLVYYCHAVPNVRVYEADILDPTTKVKINRGVAICHIDTSSWGSGQEAFRVLGSGPGKIEVCHWILENDLAWATAD